MERYHSTKIRALAAQLKRSPRRLVLRELLGIEFVLSVVEPGKHYPTDFVCHALTRFRPPADADGDGHLVDGESLISDLIALAEDLSEGAGMRAPAWLEPVYAVAELARRFDVSTKTIFRWRYCPDNA